MEIGCTARHTNAGPGWSISEEGKDKRVPQERRLRKEVRGTGTQEELLSKQSLPSQQAGGQQNGFRPSLPKQQLGCWEGCRVGSATVLNPNVENCGHVCVPVCTMTLCLPLQRDFPSASVSVMIWVFWVFTRALVGDSQG